MATKSASEPDIILYDLACTKGVCFSPVVWRIRLMLNYKQVPYRTVFVEFPDIEPTLKGLRLAPTGPNLYTVPAIHHVPTKMYMVDSGPIAQFLESTYPEPRIPLTSELGRRIEAGARSVLGATFRMSVMPREIRILSPRAQEFFRQTREAEHGKRVEDMLDQDKEEESWKALQDSLCTISELIQTHSAEGPFVLGDHPSLTDFFITGSLQCARVVDEDVFQRLVQYSGFEKVYKACIPYMEKQD